MKRLLNFGTICNDKADFHLFEMQPLTPYTEGGDKRALKKRRTYERVSSKIR